MNENGLRPPQPQSFPVVPHVTAWPEAGPGLGESAKPWGGMPRPNMEGRLLVARTRREMAVLRQKVAQARHERFLTVNPGPVHRHVQCPHTG